MIEFPLLDFINIISATSMSYSTPTGSIVDVFTCRAIGSPPPLLIRWRAENPTSTGSMLTLLSNSFEGVSISNSEEGEEEVSELRLSRDALFHTPLCRVTNDDGLMVTQETFEFIGA